MDHPAPSTEGATLADLVKVALVALVVAALVASWWFGTVASAPSEGPTASDGQRIAGIYDPPRSAIEAAYDHGDGQLFAAMATDPLGRDRQLIRGGPAEEAYRYQRPAYGWLGWVASGGQRGAIAWALVAVTVASAALLAVAMGCYLARGGHDPAWGLLALVIPGVFVDLTWVGPEILGTALAVLGLDRWRQARGDATVPLTVIALFAGAGLCRETLLLVPAVLVFVELWQRDGARSRARALQLAASAVPYVVWVGYLKVQTGSLPKGSVGGRLSPVPFEGAARAMATWTSTDQLLVLLTAAIAIAALWVARRSFLGALIAAHLVFAATLGEPVWHRSVDFERVLLPLWALAVLAVVPASIRRRGPRPTVGDPASEAPTAIGSAIAQHS